MAMLKAFNPHELPPDLIRKVATGRAPALEKIISIVRANLVAPIKQHLIISAPRGYGKSFFLRYVEVTILDVAQAEGLPVAMALLSEELPHVKEPDTLIAEIKRTFLKGPPESVGVRWSEDDGTAWQDAIAELDAAIDQRFGAGRGLLVVGVENFDVLIGKAFAKSAQSGRLRALLTRTDGRLMLLAASARGAIDRSYDVPLFQALEEVALTPWSVDEVIAFLDAQRKAAGRPALTETQHARARAVATFISGTPRLATLLGEALLEDNPLQAADILEQLIDELTPYYKERIDALPSRSQALLDALLRGGEPCSATELARRVGAAAQSAIAATLDDLRKDLLIVGDKSPDSAEVLLRVSDRVFAHYYRKRILNHGQEICPLEALVDLLALIYSPEEKKRHAEKFAARGLTREAEVMERLWQADQKPAQYSQAREDAEDAEFDTVINEWDRVTDQFQFVEGLSLLDRALAIAQEQGDGDREAKALTRRAWTLGEMGRHEEALAAARDGIAKAEKVGDLHEQARALLGEAWSLGQLRRHEEALATAREAATKLAKVGNLREEASAVRQIAWNLGQLGRLEEALATARDAVSKAETASDLPEQAASLVNVAWNLQKLGCDEEAIAAARDAIITAERGADIVEQVEALRILARSLSKLGHREEAFATAHDALTRAERAGNSEIRLFAARSFLILRPDNADQAVATYKWLIHDAAAANEGAPQLYFSDIASVVTTQREWPALVSVLSEAPEVAELIVGRPFLIGEPGKVIAAAYKADKLDNALAQARHFVTALAQAIAVASDPRLVRLWSAVIENSVNELATKIDNAQFIGDLAATLDAHPSIPAKAKAVLAAAAAYHAGGRDPAKLARIDPDLRTTLVTVFPPKSLQRASEARPKKKRRRPK
jgi:tetratricopeptide (TPR) repeat protein